MKIEKEFRDDHQVKLIVEMDADPFERAKHRAARQIARNVKIPGFRPGKAPYGVILRTVGESQVVESALELLIEEQYPEVIKQAEIEPYGPGKLENVPELDPPTFEFIIPLDAEVELGDYKAIRIPYEIPETTEEDIQAALDEIRERNATRETVDRPAQLGDTVFLRVGGVRADLEDEQDPVVIEERFSSSILREEDREDEFPFSGFSKQLIGLSPEDKKTIHHHFPDDYEQEELQGAEVDYTVVVTNIQSMTLPALDDAFAKEVSDFETLEAWKASLKDELQDKTGASYVEEYNNQIMEQIIADSTLKYPPQMVENDAREMLRGLEYRLSQQGMTKELYLQIRGMDEEALLKEIMPMAEERLKRALILFEVAQKEGIEIDQEKVQSETYRTLDAISSQMTPNEAKKLTKSHFIPNLMTNITVDMTTQRTMDFLRASAKGESWPPEVEGPQDEDGENEGVEEVKTEYEVEAEHDISATETDIVHEITSENEQEPETKSADLNEETENKSAEVEAMNEKPTAQGSKTDDEDHA